MDDADHERARVHDLPACDEWSLNRRYMQLEGLQAVSDPVLTRLSAMVR
jgi:hypothetical protein